jgi:hypothetical protein
MRNFPAAKITNPAADAGMGTKTAFPAIEKAQTIIIGIFGAANRASDSVKFLPAP